MVDARILANFKVFLSHAAADETEVLRYAAFLKDSGFAKWVYQTDLVRGERTSISAALTENIEKSDIFFLFVSDAALRSGAVQFELGTALRLQQERRREDYEKWRAFNPKAAEEHDKSGSAPPTDVLLARPIIYPIFVTQSDWRATGARPTAFPTRTLLDSEPSGAYAITMGHDPAANNTDTDKSLIAQLTPKLEIFGLARERGDSMDPQALKATGVFRLYESLFPEIEQDKEADIINWVFERDNGKPSRGFVQRRGKGWLGRTLKHRYVNHFDSWFPVLSLQGKAVAFAFLSYSIPSRLMYGNFVGVARTWRSASIADIFWKELQEKTLKVYPRCRGLVFEVEPFDLDDLDRIISYLEAQTPPRRFLPPPPGAELPDEDVIRRFLRFAWYDRRRVRVFKNADGAVLANIYPCLDPDEPEADWPARQVDFWPGWLPANPSKQDAPTWEEVVRFSSMEVLVHPLLMEYEDCAERYIEYAEPLVESVVQRAPGGVSSASRMLTSKRMNRLYRRWSELDITLAI